MASTTEIKLFKADSILDVTEKNALYCIKSPTDTEFRIVVTDKFGNPINQKDNSGGGSTNIVSNDNSIIITGTTTKNLQIASSLQTLINSALQNGSNISELFNDVGYITLADIPSFNPSGYDLSDFTNTSVDPFVKQSEVPIVSLPQTQIAFGSNTNDVTSSSNFIYDGFILYSKGNGGATGWGQVQFSVESSDSEAGISLKNTGVGGKTFNIISTSNASGIGGGKFSIAEASSSDEIFQYDSTTQEYKLPKLSGNGDVIMFIDNNGKLYTGTIPSFDPNNYDLSQFTNTDIDAFVRNSDLSSYLLATDAATIYEPLLGFIPYDASNPSGYINSSALTPYLTSSLAATTYYQIPTGTISQYLRGDGSLATFPSIPSVTPSALTKTDDTNVTLSLGGSPNTALLQSVSLTLGWTGTLDDSRISSASNWNSKEPAISAGTTSQYFRGDKTFQTLDKIAVGLPNVDDTSDVNKPVSTAQATAIGLKEDSSNKSTLTSDSGSSTKFPVWSAVVSYVTGLGYATQSWVTSNFRALFDTFNTISSLPDTITLAQANSWVRVNVSTDGNLTVPNFATAPIPIGAYYYIRQSGTGKVTLVPGSGVTLNSPDNVLTTGTQYSVIKITKQATDSWIVEVGSASYFASKIKPLIDAKQNALGFVPFDATADVQYRLKGYTIYHDFDKTVTSGGYQMTNINGGTIVQSSGYNDANHYGVLLVQSTNSANSGYYVSQIAGSGGVANILMVGLRTDFVFKTPTTIDSNSIIRFGFATGALTSEFTYGTYFEILSNSLVGKTANNSVRSSTSAYTVSADTWYHLRVEVTSLSLITYYVYDMIGTILFSATLSTNIPTAITLDSRCVMINTGSVAKTIAYPDIITTTVPPMQRGALN